MRKIVFYINAIHHGGAERVICNLATQFSERQYECVLLTSFIDEWEYKYGEKVRRDSLFDRPIKGFLKRNICLISELRHRLREEDPDVLISFMAEPNFRAIISAMGLKTKVIVSVRNDPNKEYPNFFMRILAKTLYRKATGIIFQTEDAKRWFPTSIQRKAAVIYNQVDTAFYETVYEGERHNIVTTGRLVPQKNHKMLIKAFSMIADKIPDDLYIYGDGELRSELEMLIRELNMERRVFMPGSIKNVADTIKSAKLFVLSSDYEGMPNSLMEAMALGLPCISTDCPCGGPRMLLEKRVGNDILLPVGRPDLLAKAMLKLLECDELRNRTGKILRESAALFFPDNVYHIWESFICSTDDKET